MHLCFLASLMGAAGQVSATPVSSGGVPGVGVGVGVGMGAAASARMASTMVLYTISNNRSSSSEQVVDAFLNSAVVKSRRRTTRLRDSSLYLRWWGASKNLSEAGANESNSVSFGVSNSPKLGVGVGEDEGEKLYSWLCSPFSSGVAGPNTFFASAMPLNEIKTDFPVPHIFSSFINSEPIFYRVSYGQQRKLRSFPIHTNASIETITNKWQTINEWWEIEAKP